MKKTYKIFIVFASIILCLAIWLIIIHNKFYFFEGSNENITIGIIDAGISKKYDNVTCNSDTYKEKETHGDKMLEFANESCANINIYFFDASDANDKVTTKQIIEGLDWMRNNDIKYINISLSSSKYSSELEEWLMNNKDITVYASYNNIAQSADYPAMYKKIIASGKKNGIDMKDTDYIYRTNKVIITNNLFKVYEGNSYLSLVSLIENVTEK